MLELTCQLLYFGAPLLPTALVHGLCIRYDCLKILKRPLDFGASFRRKRIFGDNKTWRGFVINVLFCTLGTIIQAQLQSAGHIPQWLPSLLMVLWSFLLVITLHVAVSATGFLLGMRKTIV